MSTEPNQVRWVGIRLAAGETALPVSVIDPPAINDADGDTKIDTEIAPDEDKIHIYIAGVEVAVIDASGIDVKSNKIVSLGAPTAATDAARLGDIAVDTNLSAAAQDAVTKKHTQNTDKKIIDADADTQVQVEESADEDKIRMDVKGVEAVVINDAGKVGIGVTPAATGAILQIKDGITFPATQVPSADANTLDDYEEGTWTPAISFGGGTTGITYSTQLGRYLKIGKRVWINAVIILTSKGSSTGAALVTGRPFTSGAGLSYTSPCTITFNKITFANIVTAFIEANSTTITLAEVTEAGVETTITNADFADNSILTLSGHYEIE